MKEEGVQDLWTHWQSLRRVSGFQTHLLVIVEPKRGGAAGAPESKPHPFRPPMISKVTGAEPQPVFRGSPASSRFGALTLCGFLSYCLLKISSRAGQAIHKKKPTSTLASPSLSSLPK
ncbi:hypothetical protein BR93DRAFT_498883 [Coniochaeta sp. PMI_546]|nr:hypothetical protein BR93DRAFT_498883 [Coniochaeta sp. PMI_546]